MDDRANRALGKLSIKSADFRRLWSRNDVKPIHGALPSVRIRHLQLGPIELHHQKLEIPDPMGRVAVRVAVCSMAG